MITTFEKRYVLKNYIILLIPIFDTTYKGKNRSKNKCELYITNWSYYYKIGIGFAMYQRMGLKGTSWARPRHIRNYLCKKHNIHIVLVLNVHTGILYVHDIFIFIFVSNKFLSRSKFFEDAKFLTVGNLRTYMKRELKIESFLTSNTK